MLWLGLGMLVVGGGVTAISVTCNSSTPIQVGPVPVIGGASVALCGLILFLSHI